jgi:hypothetical protein
MDRWSMRDTGFLMTSYSTRTGSTWFQNLPKGKILKVCHDSPTTGHQGYFKTYRQIRERFSWKGLKDDVLKHIQECTTCQQNKFEQTHPAGLLQPLPIPEQKWESISMDFITGLPRVQGRDCIFVVVDRLTKFFHISFPYPQTTRPYR